ncbi:MAG: M55 family metallopeptidase [Candidatus Riflebacteria bacterium]|nr:M55 family metallopeptidase [Candidatus Riflebacteria bacterium]
MKLYIVGDAEGIGGVVSPNQISNSEDWETETIRRQFTDEICAVCAGAFEGGVNEIYVNDFHGNGRNIIIERLPQQILLIRGEFRPTSGFDLLDESFSGIIFLGAHARTGSWASIIPHTYSEKVNFEIFGQPVGEFDILSLLAGEFKVPTILVSGDAKTIEQAKTNLPFTQMVTSKYALSHNAAICVHPKKICTELRNKTRIALKNLSSIEPPAIVPPIQLTINLKDIKFVEKVMWIPGLKRTKEDVFEFIGSDMRQIAHVIYGITILTS